MLKIYVCGPTLYNSPHIGNLRPIITFDLMLKAYRAQGKKFFFLHNITDIDDKIINKALSESKNESEVSNFYLKEYRAILKKFNVNTITKIENVTKNIKNIIQYINNLYLSKNAYKDENKNIWFDILKNEKYYGIVSKQKLINMFFDEDEEYSKKHKADFALWKTTTKGIKFDSNFGSGRPGWHTECCALINKHFGPSGVDIHGGGMDLTFPHHENENIQHYALFKKPIARRWIRCGQIALDGEKMSKSLGNVILVKDFVKKHSPLLLKLIFLNSKITANINITPELINNMKSIEIKYRKIIFKILTTFNTKNLYTKCKKREFLKNSYKAVSNLEFSDFNLLVNEEIKRFNKEPDIFAAKNLFTIFSVILPELVDKKYYEKSIDLFAKWKKFLSKKDYKNADAIRNKLIQKKLI
ncbi:class I tRNA ligase family protein [Mycoplasma tauri]|uniref:Class I tRNA ligase family protein n=3 Tax=Mycoplasma tauri TaxID=547987 RepID=A0A953NCK5_9MOLU|nr:class I tRNA ligase family protein [Mycoplasma tauri]MBZ4195381.1 class I tRNA ligase family protein [Mycoplasma tauri]MBZ4203980.1 class I tRNA ligase family protein [Mycoplasma tauri]MBZ4218473.1 class I tRNA ligase family protein [Mycoplasma tauri]